MTGQLEIERKFLIESLPNIHGLPCIRIRQGYISSGATEVRLRQSNQQYFLTCKQGTGLVRIEKEIELTDKQFQSLWSMTEGRRIDKMRYIIQSNAKKIELDVYSGHLENLVVAEVEFESIPDSDAFELPQWFGSEITDDSRYKNKNLATEGIPS